MEPTRLIFFGTADLACPILAALARQNTYTIASVVTQPDRAKDRDLKLQPPPVKREALSRGLSVSQPARARNSEFIQSLAELRPDLMVVVAYGQILPQALLDVPRYGCLNVHTSLLPKYRGAAPIQWAILNDEVETGVTIMKMDAGLDTGEILTQQSTPIRAEDNAQTLHDRLAQIGSELLLATIPDYISGKIVPCKQSEHGASYARKITKEDGQLDWTMPARSLWNRVRAFAPWPGAFTFLPDEPKLPLIKIWDAVVDEHFSGAAGEILHAERAGIVIGCGEQSLRVLALQREGGRRVTAQEFLSGYPIKAGAKLG